MCQQQIFVDIAQGLLHEKAETFSQVVKAAKRRHGTATRACRPSPLPCWWDDHDDPLDLCGLLEVLKTMVAMMVGSMTAAAARV